MDVAWAVQSSFSMLALLALLAPVFAVDFFPMDGGQVALYQQYESTPVLMVLNNLPICRVTLTESEADDVAQTMADVLTDDDLFAESIPFGAGGWLMISQLGADGLYLMTNGELGCTVSLTATHDEPKRVIALLTEAAE
jgi:hypothetical protein